MEQKIPNFFIVGNPKCGTTAMYAFLKQHPDIYIPEGEKEPSFFCKDFHKEIDDFYKKHRRLGKLSNFFCIRTKEQYLNLYKKAKNEKILGDLSTPYLYSKVAAEEIKKFNPDAKIIIILREPARFLYSLYNNEFGQLEDASTFEEALALENPRKKGIFSTGVFPPVSFLFYSERIKYYEQVKRYLDLFGKNVKVVIYEKYKKNNTKTLKEIFKFLKIDENFMPKLSQEYVSVEVRFRKLKIFLHKILVSKPWRLFKTNLPKKIWKPLSQVYEKTFYTKNRLHKMYPELETILKKKAKKEVKKINSLVKEDLIKIWGYGNV